MKAKIILAASLLHMAAGAQAHVANVDPIEHVLAHSWLLLLLPLLGFLAPFSKRR